MKWCRFSELRVRIVGGYLLLSLLALAVTSALLLYLVTRAAQADRFRDADYLAQLAKQVDTPASLGAGAEQAYLIRADVGRAVIMSPEALKAFRSGTNLPELLLIGHSFRRSILERPTFAPLDPSPVPAVVSEELSTALGKIADPELNRLSSQAQWVTVCPAETRGTGVNCAVIIPLQARPPVDQVAVAMLPPGEADEIYNQVVQWLPPLGTLLLLAAAAVAWPIAWRITSPLQSIQRVAERVAAGDLTPRVGETPSGEMGRVVAVFNQAIDELAAASALQEERDRKRRELIASVSHEFRAPLASLRGYLELLRAGVIPPENQGRYLSVMLSDTVRLNRLLDDLVEWARIQTHQITLRPMPTDPVDACHRVAEQLRWQARERSVELELALPAGLPLVLADPDRLDQVLVNLLENALRYAGKGGWVRLTADLEAGGTAVRIAVIDSGPGIPPAEQPKVWERFYKVNQARTPGDEGSGLGLSIVKQIIEAMGGQVGLHSQVGRGATFWITLPAVESEAPALEDASA